MCELFEEVGVVGAVVVEVRVGGVERHGGSLVRHATALGPMCSSLTVQEQEVL